MPARTQAAPPATQSSSGGIMSGLASTVAQGMAFGTGSAIAHRAVGAVANSFGGGSESQQPVAQQYEAAAPSSAPAQSGACAQDKEMFYDCLKMNKGDQSSCQFLYDQLKQCQMSADQMSFQ